MQATMHVLPNGTMPAPRLYDALQYPSPAQHGNVKRSLDPSVFDLSGFANNSNSDIAAWTDLVSLHRYNPQLTADPLPQMNQNFSKGLQVVALTALTAGTPLGFQWANTQLTPPTAAQWDNVVETLQAHPTMSSPHVKELLQVMPGADVVAIRDLYDLTDRFFGDVAGLEREYDFHRDHDTNEPLLFLTIRTNGMDVDELLRREIALHEEAGKQPGLKSTTRYHIITAV